MRKSGTLYIILEIVTILSNIIIGVSILTLIAYQAQEHLELNKSFIGSIILALVLKKYQNKIIYWFYCFSNWSH